MLVEAVVAWLSLALVVGVAMRRRGHDLFFWSFITLALGPLALPIAITASGRRTSSVVTRHPGKMDVLVADDGSSGALAALAAATALLPSATSWTFAEVLDAEAPTTPRGANGERDVRRRLEAHATAARPDLHGPVDTTILIGEPAAALSDYASTNGYELIVAGARGDRPSTTLLGSVARRLASNSPVPVLLGPSPPR